VEMIDAIPVPGGRLRLLARVPHLWTWPAIIGAVAIAVIFGYFRAGMGVVYTESIPFLCLALVLGMFSPAASLVMLIVFVPLDFASALQSHALDPLIPALAGRVVSWWLLFVLAVAIPLMCRGTPGAALASNRAADPIVRRLLGYGLAGLVCVVLVWLWTQAEPFLIRPVFTWSSALGDPTTAAVVAVQQDWKTIATAALFGLMGFTLLRDALGSLDEEANEIRLSARLPSATETRLLSEPWQVLVQILSALFFTVMLGGIVTQAIDVVIVFGKLAFAGPGVRVALIYVPALVEAMTRVPWLARFLLGAVLGYTLALAINQALGVSQTASEFFSMVLSVAVGLFLFELFLEADLAAGELADPRGRKTDSQPQPAQTGGPAGGVGAAALVAVALLLIVPAGVHAASCADVASCPSSAEARAAASEGAAALIVVTTMAAARHVSASQNRLRLKRRRRRRRGRTSGPHASRTITLLDRVADEVSRARDRALDNYRRG
jgi:hypothetical protein